MDPLEEVTSKQRPEGTTIQNVGRELHVEGTAYAKTQRRKGNLGAQIGHTADNSWT